MSQFKKHIPNMLTILRMLLVPVFIWLLFWTPGKHSEVIALVVFIVASITDYYDGMLARKYQIISNFGKVMDPLADKLLVASALVALALPPYQALGWLVVGIILFREVAVTLLREYYLRKHIVIAANYWGKVKTTIQMIGIIAALAYFALIPSEMESPTVLTIFRVYFWITAVITILSGWNYFVMRKRPEAK